MNQGASEFLINSELGLIRMLENVEFQVSDSTLFLHCPSIDVAQKLSKDINDICIRLLAMKDEWILNCEDVWVGMNSVCFVHVDISRQALQGRKMRFEKVLRRRCKSK